MPGFYYLDSDRNPRGPVSLEQLTELRQGGTLTGDSLVAREGDSEWRPLAQFDGLPPAIPAHARKSSGNRTLVWVLVIAGAGLGMLFIMGILAGLAIPAINAALSKAKLMHLMNSGKQLQVALVFHAQEHGGVFPSELEELKSSLKPTQLQALLHSPQDGKPLWIYHSGLSTDSPSSTVLLESVEEIRSGNRKGKVYVSVSGQVDWSGNPDFVPHPP